MISCFITAHCCLALFQKLVNRLIFFLGIILIEGEIGIACDFNDIFLTALEEFLRIGIYLIKSFGVNVLIPDRCNKRFNIVAQRVAFGKVGV